MEGKIINHNTIKGEDGNYYKFETSDFKDADDLSEIVVTFTPNRPNATDIKISIAIDEVANSISPNKLKSIKSKAYLVATAQILVFAIPAIRNVFGIVKLVLEYMLIKEIKTQTKSHKILYNWVVSLIITLLLTVVVVVSTVIELTIKEIFSSNFSKILQVEKFFVYVTGTISLIYLYRYYKELAYVTQKNGFKWIFWIYVVSIYSVIYSQKIYMILSVIYAILYIYLWVKVGNLIPSSNKFDGKKSKFKIKI